MFLNSHTIQNSPNSQLGISSAASYFRSTLCFFWIARFLDAPYILAPHWTKHCPRTRGQNQRYHQVYGNSASHIASFLNTLPNCKDEGTRRKLGMWASTDGPRAWVDAWKGEDDWALRRLQGKVRLETKRMGRKSQLKIHANKLQDPNSIKFDVAQMYQDMQNSVPTIVAILDAVVSIPPRVDTGPEIEITVLKTETIPASRIPLVYLPSSQETGTVSDVEDSMDVESEEDTGGEVLTRSQREEQSWEDAEDGASVDSYDSDDGYLWDNARARRQPVVAPPVAPSATDTPAVKKTRRK